MLAAHTLLVTSGERNNYQEQRSVDDRYERKDVEQELIDDERNLSPFVDNVNLAIIAVLLSYE